jgi:hypothetical protein
MDRVTMGAHLATCSGCRTYLAQMNATVEALADVAPEMRAPDDLQAALAARLAESVAR